MSSRIYIYITLISPLNNHYGCQYPISGIDSETYSFFSQSKIWFAKTIPTDEYCLIQLMNMNIVSYGLNTHTHIYTQYIYIYIYIHSIYIYICYMYTYRLVTTILADYKKSLGWSHQPSPTILLIFRVEPYHRLRMFEARPETETQDTQLIRVLDEEKIIHMSATRNHGGCCTHFFFESWPFLNVSSRESLESVQGFCAMCARFDDCSVS